MNIKTIHDFRRAIRYGPYAWPGGYPIFFITEDGACLSFDTVKSECRSILESIRDYPSGSHGTDGWRVVASDINWEIPNLIDNHTGERIESAYAEPE